MQSSIPLQAAVELLQCKNYAHSTDLPKHIKLQELAAVGEVGSHPGIETMAQEQCPQQLNNQSWPPQGKVNPSLSEV